MKTLDEVLEAMTYEVGLNSKTDCWEVPVNLYGVIVHYLHEYQDVKNVLVEISDNSPLTWDQLTGMKAKPVWVEYSGYTPNWEIIENIGAARGSVGDFTGNFIETNKSILHKDEQGKVWQAYGKERE